MSPRREHPSVARLPSGAQPPRRSWSGGHSAGLGPHRRTRRRGARLRGGRDRQQPPLRRRRVAGAAATSVRTGSTRRAVAERLGVERLRRASPELVREHTGQVIGGVSPLGPPGADRDPTSTRGYAPRGDLGSGGPSLSRCSRRRTTSCGADRRTRAGDGVTTWHEIWINPACSKCRTAQRALEEAGVEHTVRRYLDDPPTAEELGAVVERLGLEPWDVARAKEAREAGIDLPRNAAARGSGWPRWRRTRARPAPDRDRRRRHHPGGARRGDPRSRGRPRATGRHTGVLVFAPWHGSWWSEAVWAARRPRRACAKLGHEVTLLERGDRLGGALVAVTRGRVRLGRRTLDDVAPGGPP